MFESLHQKLLPRRRFLRRQARSLLLGFGTLGFALSVGVAGYHWIAGLKWIDALLDASMILSGMGPVNELKTDAGKIFASVYAIFSGVVFISAMAVVLSPSVHRMLHKFHLDEGSPKGGKDE